MRKFVTLLFIAGLLWTPVFAQSGGTDPISGKWTGDWGPSRLDRNQVTVDLKLQGKTITGNVNPGANAVAIKNGTFDDKTNAIHMEADAKGPGDQTVHFVIDGKLDKNTMTGTWNHGARKGDFKITKE
jgi:hypothetical protein